MRRTYAALLAATAALLAVPVLSAPASACPQPQEGPPNCCPTPYLVDIDVAGHRVAIADPSGHYCE
jgi:hypothetical protein